PEYLPALIQAEILPDTAEFQNRMKAAYDRAPLGDDAPQWKPAVHDWLMTHGRYFRDQLVEAAGRMKFEDDHLSGLDELRALARLDWPTAEPIVSRLEAADEPHVPTGSMAI